jgi:hypothetical protein
MGSGKSSAPPPKPPPPETEPFDQTVDPDKRAKAQDQGQVYIEKADEQEKAKRQMGNQTSSTGLNVG